MEKWRSVNEYQMNPAAEGNPRAAGQGRGFIKGKLNRSFWQRGWRKVGEWGLVAQTAGDVGENAVVNDGGVVGEKRASVGEPERGPSRGRGVAGADNAILQMNVGIQVVVRLGVLGGQGGQEFRAGAQGAMEIGEGDSVGEFGAGMGAADGKEAGDTQSAGMGRIGGRRRGIAGDQAAQGDADHVHLRGPERII